MKFKPAPKATRRGRVIQLPSLIILCKAISKASGRSFHRYDEASWTKNELYGPRVHRMLGMSRFRACKNSTSSTGSPNESMRSVPDLSRHVSRKLSSKPKATWWTCFSCVELRNLANLCGSLVLRPHQHHLQSNASRQYELFPPRWTLEEMAAALPKRERGVAHDG
jgi:hypothetical protein